MKRLLLVAALSLAACSHGARVEPGEAPGKSTHEPRVAVDAGTAPATVAPDNPAVTPAAPPAKVKLFVGTKPPKVLVTWGKKKLGPTPFTLERPRDSGPVDLVLRAPGYLTVHTRAYTVKNDTIGVKLVKLQDRMTVFGAKQEIPENAPSDPSLDPNGLKPAVPPVGPPGSPTVPPAAAPAPSP